MSLATADLKHLRSAEIDAAIDDVDPQFVIQIPREGWCYVFELRAAIPELPRCAEKESQDRSIDRQQHREDRSERLRLGVAKWRCDK